MKESIITIIALIFVCLGVAVIFFKKDIFKEKVNKLTTTSGFVVSCVALLIIYLVNR